EHGGADDRWLPARRRERCRGRGRGDRAGDPMTVTASLTSDHAARRRPRRDWSAIRLVVGKDLTAVRRSKGIVIPMIVVPTFLLVVLPLVLAMFARNAPTETVANALSSSLVKDMVKPILHLPAREQ